MIKRVLAVAAALWVGRWLALEIAVRIAHRRGRPAVAPKDSPWPPGRMPTRG